MLLDSSLNLRQEKTHNFKQKVLGMFGSIMAKSSFPNLNHERSASPHNEPIGELLDHELRSRFILTLDGMKIKTAPSFLSTQQWLFQRTADKIFGKTEDGKQIYFTYRNPENWKQDR